MTEPTCSQELVSWAARAGYSATSGTGAPILHSALGEYRYYAYVRDDGWYLLTFASRAGAEKLELAAATMEIIERYLIGEFSYNIRDELGLPFLMPPPEVAPGYQIGELSTAGYRTLSQDGVGPIARAREATTSLLTLIPLSHYLRLTVVQLEESFLSSDGPPLFEGLVESRGEQ